jgi:predicted porin
MNVKFTIVAAAAMAATILPAQVPNIPVAGNTNITISGLLAIGAKNSQISNSARPGMEAENYLGDNTSRLYFNSNSKIADGWSVIAQVGSRFEANNGPGTNLVPNANATPGTPFVGFTTGAYYGGWAEDDTWGGVSSPYGTVTFGKKTVFYSDTIEVGAIGLLNPGESYRVWDANELGTFNLMDYVMKYNNGVLSGSQGTLGLTRSQNVVNYTSPVLGPCMFVVNVSKNPYGSEYQYGASTPLNYENGGMINAKGIYNKGPISASLSFLDVKPQGGPSTGLGNTQAYRAGISYKDPMGFKVGVVFDHTAVSNAIVTTSNPNGSTASRDVFQIPVSYYLGNHGFYATYTHAGSYSGISNSSATQYNLQDDYAMTKRASVGLCGALLRNNSNTAYGPFLAGTNLGPSGVATGEYWRQISLDLMYWF